jgi:hypothetical protein
MNFRTVSKLKLVKDGGVLFQTLNVSLDRQRLLWLSPSSVLRMSVVAVVLVSIVP